MRELSYGRQALILPVIFLLCVCELSAIWSFKEILHHLVR